MDGARPPGGRSGARGRTMGIDYGHKRVGVALSDGLGVVAHPLEVIEAGPGLLPALAGLVREHEVARVVVGLPTSLDGVERAAAEAARVFAGEVEAELEVEVVMYDERFTSKIAEQALAAGGVPRSERRARVDKAAAAVMLQGYLDRRPRPSRGGGRAP